MDLKQGCYSSFEQANGTGFSTVDFGGLQLDKQPSQAQTRIHGITCISTGHCRFVKSNVNFSFLLPSASGPIET